MNARKLIQPSLFFLFAAMCSHAMCSVSTADDAATTDRPAPTKSVALAGEVYGVASIQLPLDEAAVLHADQSLIVQESSRRTRFPAFATTSDQDGLKTLRIHFLFQGKAPLKISVKTAHATLVDSLKVTVVDDEAAYDQRLSQWWKAFLENSTQAGGKQRVFRDYLANMLARRLRLPLDSSRLTAKKRPMANLEKQFERVVSTVFGIDSVLLAMPDEVTVSESGLPESASRALPAPVRVQPVRIPSGNWGAQKIEPLAYRAPRDCFYVRCESLDNFRWLRSFMMGWNGSLEQIVASQTESSLVRQTIETQLVLDADAFEAGENATPENKVSSIQDMAFIGSDLFFNDGSGVGVLLQARDSDRMMEQIKAQRAAVLRNNPEVEQIVVKMNGWSVPLIQSPGNEVRSFYLRDGDFHLVTNSQDIAQKFIESGKSRSGLGYLQEFIYSRHKAPEKGRVWMYLSDPFFRRLVSPAFRIETGRRVQALSEIRDYQFASLAASADGVNDISIEMLKQKRYLRNRFGMRADGSEVTVVNGQPLDSLRGAPGAFLPIADMGISRATQAELNEYASFTRRYLRNWRRMDPVIVSMGSRPGGDGLEIVDLNIVVTPYARERYQNLAAYLDRRDRSRFQISRQTDDILSLETGLKSGSAVYQVHIGLQDEAVPFKINDGKVIRQGKFASTEFADRNFYAVTNPSKTEGLRMIRALQQSLDPSVETVDIPRQQQRETSANTRAATDSVLSIMARPYAPVLPAMQLANVFVKPSLKGVENAILSQRLTQVDGWAIYSRSKEVRSLVAPQLDFEKADPKTQLRFRMRDVLKSRVAPYIQAYTFLESRKASAENAQLLDMVHQQFNISPLDAKDVAEELFRTRFVCPLGGQYMVEPNAECPTWRSTAWSASSYFEVKKPPADFEFPFLAWLRGIDAAFHLDSTTLSARVQLTVSPAEKN